MATQKFYAVANGRVPGIYTTWKECQDQTSGFSGAVYRSFSTFDEADQYIEDYETKNGQKTGIHEDALLPIFELRKKYNDNSKAIAFVDGSFYEPDFRYSCGGIVIFNGNVKEFAEAGDDYNLVSMRNVAGEILGSKKAMQICLDNNIPELNLFYDYEGIENWCTGVWKTNKVGTMDYKNYYDSIKSKLKVNFIKVKGHSGVELNERVDRLAKGALGLV